MEDLKSKSRTCESELKEHFEELNEYFSAQKDLSETLSATPNSSIVSLASLSVKVNDLKEILLSSECFFTYLRLNHFYSLTYAHQINDKVEVLVEQEVLKRIREMNHKLEEKWMQKMENQMEKERQNIIRNADVRISNACDEFDSIKQQNIKKISELKKQVKELEKKFNEELTQRTEIESHMLRYQKSNQNLNEMIEKKNDEIRYSSSLLEKS
jgi:DNA repair exonuclease SbcCD ATPase subunit